MKVLVTGAGGWTATSIVLALDRARHDIVGFDRPAVRCPAETSPSIRRKISGDVSDIDQVQAAIHSAAPDVIIHLAVAVDKEDYRKPDLPFAVNVQGTYNIFAAARMQNVGKIVLISSAPVHLPPQETKIYHAQTDWISSSEDDHLYDLTKRLQEEIARDFCETFGMQVVVLRAGQIVDGRERVDPRGRDLANLDYAPGGWVCRYDLARACLKALELNPVGYAAYHVVGSQQARRHFDIARTEKELGLAFESRFEGYD